MRLPDLSVRVAIALLAAAILAFEIVLLRIFSFAIWHHFAFMVISVALLGVAISGVVIQRRPDWTEPAPRRAAGYALAFAASVVVALFVVGRVPLDPTRLALGPGPWLRLGLYYLALLVPMTAAGLAVGTLLRGYAASAPAVYGSDLLGAAVGALAALALLAPLGAEGFVLAIAAAACLAAAVLRAGAARPAASVLRAAAPALACAALAIAAVPLAPSWLGVRPGPGKLLGRLLGTPAGPAAPHLVATRWNPLARVDVVENAPPVQWTLNDRSPVAHPGETQLLLDGDAATPIVQFGDAPLQDLDLLDWTLGSAAYQLLRPERVLVIGAGGGVDVLTALHHGARAVDAVEINGTVIDLVRGPLAAAGGHPLERPGVTLHEAEGRAFVRASRATYDLVQLSLIDTWAASASGAYSLSEGYLYTVEALEDDLERLAPDGALTVTRWDWNPPRESLRLVAVADEALRRHGAANPARHLLIFGLGRMANLVVKKSPFTAEEVARARELAARRGFFLVYEPERPPATPYAAYLAAPDRRAFAAGYPFDISPSTDDRPYFFQFGRWSNLRLFGAGWRDDPLILSGRLVLVAVLLQALLLSVPLLALALGPRGSSAGRGGPSIAVYFAALGVAFMLVEISLMQRLTLFLGSPVTAAAVVLATLLAAAGAGSLLLAPRASTLSSPWPFAAATAGAIALYALILPAVLRGGLALGNGARVGAAIALVLPLGVLLGIPFPAALARLERGAGGAPTGLAWAANGIGSVLGPILAALLALDLGLSAVMLLGAAGYLVAGAAISPRWGR